ncbi:MAG: exodeoxyribonuclease III [Candidatus Omnitrophica bacterium]|nr:exodeoxyribonuclease III [Candidatus Omnitrophota bacterium]
MSFTLCTFNVNGIRSAGRKGFSEWLKKHQPNYLALQEMRALPDQAPPEVAAPRDYCARWVPAERKGYSGVATYTRTEPLRYWVGSGLDWGDREGRVLRADFPDFTFVNVYIPSGSASGERLALKYEYAEHFLGYTRSLLDEGRPVALCGDFNVAHEEIDIHDPKGNAKNSGFLPEEREWLSRLLAQGWVDTFRALHPGVPGLYSWWSNRGRAREKDLGWRIDYILTTPDLAERASKAWIDKQAGLSDHAPVWVEFE